MENQPRAEKPCIFFLVPLIVGCTIVAALTCEAVHLVLRVLPVPMGDHWALYIGIAVVVAALVEGIRRLTKEEESEPSDIRTATRSVASTGHS